MDQRQVLFVHQMALDLPLQVEVGGTVLRDEETPARLDIEAMDDPREHIRSALPHDRVVLEVPLHIRQYRSTTAIYTVHAEGAVEFRRLVEDGQMIVLPHDAHFR